MVAVEFSQKMECTILQLYKYDRKTYLASPRLWRLVRLPFDIDQKLGLVLSEVFMHEFSVMRVLNRLVEIILQRKRTEYGEDKLACGIFERRKEDVYHVQLANEGLEIRMLEILRQNLLGELFDLCTKESQVRIALHCKSTHKTHFSDDDRLPIGAPSATVAVLRRTEDLERLRQKSRHRCHGTTILELDLKTKFTMVRSARSTAFQQMKCTSQQRHTSADHQASLKMSTRHFDSNVLFLLRSSKKEIILQQTMTPLEYDLGFLFTLSPGLLGK